jgi:hypothetical protein
MKLFLIAIAIAAAPSGVIAGAEAEVDTVMNRWHRAAATADEAVFFGSMTDGAIYLGTDPGERWTKQQFMEWSKEHFDRESAWAFRPYDRVVYLSQENNVAWFEELLETWMGTCRGSGVLLRQDGGWKIAHYNLAVTVPNELIEEYIGIFDRRPDESKAGGND